MTEAEGWFSAQDINDIGQIAGVDVDRNGNVLIFHRGSHVWDKDSFDQHENFQQRDKGMRAFSLAYTCHNAMVSVLNANPGFSHGCISLVLLHTLRMLFSSYRSYSVTLAAVFVLVTCKR